MRVAGRTVLVADGVMQRLTLTFDNGPTPAITDWVLDVLRDRGVHATFFVIGSKLQQPGGRALAERAINEGHWVGNHSMSHKRALGEESDEARIETEINGADALLDGLRHPDRLFRPFGNGGIIDRRILGPDAVNRLKAGGYTVVLWNSIPHDWDDPDGWVERAFEQCDPLDHAVPVLHDYDTGALRHLERFLDELERRDVTIVSEFPDSVIPVRRGVETAAVELITWPVASEGEDGLHRSVERRR